MPRPRHRLPALGILPAAAMLAFAVLVWLEPATALASWTTSPYVSTPICTATGDQFSPVGCSDGAGGAIYAWADYRNGNWDVYAQRVNAAGAPLWTADGVPVCTAAADQTTGSTALPLCVASDGAGGAFMVWEDRRTSGTTGIDVYAQHLSATGSALWAANGAPVTTSAGDQTVPGIAPDGSGGLYVIWWDHAGGGSIKYQQMNGSGSPVLAGDFPLVTGTVAVRGAVKCVTDGSGGFIYAFSYAGSATMAAGRIPGAGQPPASYFFILLYPPATSNVITLDDLAPDGKNGAILAYNYAPSQSSYQFEAAMRIDGTGNVQWNNVLAPPTPLAVLNLQSAGSIVADGMGGAFIAWTTEFMFGGPPASYFISAQRVGADGRLAWPAPAILSPIGSLTLTNYPRGCPDGAGGAFFVWEDHRNGTTDVYAQDVLADGTMPWSGGKAVCLALNEQYQPFPVADGRGGAIVEWCDSRSLPTGYDVLAERLDYSGNLGDLAPTIVSVRDVANDQGGHVSVKWAASPYDVPRSAVIYDYRLWRQVPSAIATAALGSGALVVPSGGRPSPGGARQYRITHDGVEAYYWEYVASQTATGFPDYSYVAPTLADSVAGSNPYTRFLVEAANAIGNTWSSPPDSGYSVDNLAPAVPAPFTGQYRLGAAYLFWNPNPDADLAGYRLYRGASPGFTPSPASLISAQVGTGYVDAAGRTYVYELTAVDIHGNESAPAILLPTGALSVGPGAPTSLEFALASANPARGAAVLDFALPEAGNVSLGIFDTQGREVRELASGSFSAGRYEERWTGLDATGHRVSGGLYFARLDAPGGARVQRIVFIE